MPGLALLDALLRRIGRLGLMPDTSMRIIADLHATLDALAAAGIPAPDAADADAVPDAADVDAAEAVVTGLVGDLLVQVAGLARVLGLEADATAREAGARLRGAVDAVVARAADAEVEAVALPAAERFRAWPTAVT
jgi:hypothetical protein